MSYWTGECVKMNCLNHQTEALKLLHELLSNRRTGNNPDTVADKARESVLSRLVDILSQIISIERDLTLSAEVKCFLRHKVRAPGV